MASIGAEVGQKMRSAIKAKLLELNCYVDDELPDYVMVMVANKRTKSQMKEDLQLFLSNKTGTFVDWLHIVLKKLKEVTVTNPDVIKKSGKRKAAEIPNIALKKEKKDKKLDKKVKKESREKTLTSEDAFIKSLTDDLPINASKLSEQRKVIVMQENKANNNASEMAVIHDSFDIPLLSEVNLSTEEELEDIEKKIRSVKSRLGLLIESDEEDYISLKPEPDELSTIKENKKKAEAPKTACGERTPSPKKPERARITFEEESQSSTKRKSVLERLGKRRSSENEEMSRAKRNRIDFSEFREDQDKGHSSKSKKDRSKESVLNRLGVMSKVSVPIKPPEEPEEPFKNREVPSVVKIKPRIIPSDAPQPNKNLLLKAVAEAQKSVAQMPKVGSNKPDALFTKKYKEKLNEEPPSGKKLSQLQKDRIKKILSSIPNDKDENVEYVPTPINETQEPPPQYIPSAKLSGPEESVLENGKVKQKFIITLDGIKTTKYKDLATEENPKPSIKERLDRKKSPSPIIFDRVSSPVKTKSNIPDKLPLVKASPSVKNKERCKYWPSCRHGEKCEFVHPVTNCDKFPHCKFGDNCLYIHPSCKFGSSCSRRDCPYSHSIASKGSRTLVSTTLKLSSTQTQTCKFYPHCANINCTFFHPKPCKFGKYCKNQAECNFSHTFLPKKSNLTWRSK